MNARELTKEVMEQQNRIIDLEKEVQYLSQRMDKLALMVKDLSYDIIMYNDGRPTQRGRETQNNGNL